MMINISYCGCAGLRSLCLGLLLITMAGLGCRKEESYKIENFLLSSIENHKYNFCIRLYAHRLTFSDGDAPTSIWIDHITFKSFDNGEEIRYFPRNNAGEGNPKFYFENILSPDEETLVLPQGFFEGFGFIHAKNAMKNIKNQLFFETIVLEEDNGTGLWHEFAGWDGNEAIKFNAGLSGDMTQYRFDFRTKKCIPISEGRSSGVVAITSTGKAPATSW